MNRGEGNEKDTAASLGKTSGVALTIAGAITVVAVFYSLWKNRPEDGALYLSHFLPWMLPYGLFSLLSAAFGVVFFLNVADHPRFGKPGSLVVLVLGALIGLSAVPLGIFLGAIDFMISLRVIGVCVAVIAFLSFSEYRKKAAELK